MKLDCLYLQELQDIITELGEPKFRAKQVFEWIHNKNVGSFADMTNLPKEFREKLASKFEMTGMKIYKKFSSNIDETKKYLLLLEDNNMIETVFLKYSYGNTLCISSQVGCRMGCSFCASTKNGLVRNLTPGEMLNQIYLVQKDVGEKINNVVIMGSGEPLENFDTLIRFLELVNHKSGQNLSHRKITISTCGIVPKIYELADMDLQITLAISLHAANQDKRSSIMPIAKAYDLSELKKACKYYVEKTNKRITFEYILIDQVNDSNEDAINLVNYTKDLLCNINLIPYNKIKESNVNTSRERNINKFKDILTNNNINATVRRELGSDINAACGQLRRDHLTNIENNFTM